ncbi:MAG: DUF6435 family protein [Verrucomicrobiota bacterium]
MSLFKKDPVKKLQQQYEKKLLEARDMQRAGNIQAFSARSAEADELLKKIAAAKGGK